MRRFRSRGWDAAAADEDTERGEKGTDLFSGNEEGHRNLFLDRALNNFRYGQLKADLADWTCDTQSVYIDKSMDCLKKDGILGGGIFVSLPIPCFDHTTCLMDQNVT